MTNTTTHTVGIAVAAAIVAGALGAAIGAESAEQPEPEAVAIAPAACSEAFALADANLDVHDDVLTLTAGLFSDEIPTAIRASGNGDAATLARVTDQMSAHTDEVSDLLDQLDHDSYEAAKRECLR